MVGEILIGIVSLAVLSLPFIMLALLIMQGIEEARWRKEREKNF